MILYYAKIKRVYNIKNLMVYPEFKTKIFSTLDIIKSNSDKLKVDEVWLFGSVARGEATYNSDIDLLILTYGNPKDVSYIVEELDIRDDVGYPNVDIVVRTQKQLNDSYWVFNEEVKRDKIVLWKRGDLGEF